MKALFVKLLTWWKVVLLPWLLKLGLVGMGLAALLDSASVPIPMDLLLATYVWSDRKRLLLYALMGGVGSALGALVPYLLGRAGGELFLLKHVDRRKFDRMRDRFEKQEFLAMLIPSMLPPPTPWKAFAFGAGVFEMKIRDFMAAVLLGRFLRWVVLGLLVIKFGPSAADMAGNALRHHALAVLGGVGLVLLAILGLFLRRRDKD